MRTPLVRALVGGPAAFRQRLERLGPTFVKLGQFLALRPDVIPQEYADELMRLLDRVEPFPWAQARAILDAELGARMGQFREIDSAPVGAGSLAQVHRAVTRDGRQLALKILRPGFHRRVSTDLRRAQRVARLVRLAQPDFIVDPSEVVAELRSWLERELDFDQEAGNIERLGEMVGDDPTVAIPRVYRDLTTASVLTTDYLEGIPLTQVLEDPERAAREARDFEARGLAETLVRSTLRQIFEHHFFHADVHPGNLLLLSGNTLGYVDFGLCESIDQAVSREQARYLAAVYSYDLPRMFQALLGLLTPGSRADAEGLRADFLAESVRWGHAREGPPTGRSPIAQFLVGVMRAARRNRFQVPTQLLAMYRTLLTTEGTAHRLAPGVDLRTVGRDALVDLQVRTALRDITPEELGQRVLSLLHLVRESPDRVNQILSDLAERRLAIHLVSTESTGERRARDASTRMIVAGLALVAVAFWTGQHGEAWPRWAWAIALSLMAALSLYMFAQWRSTR